MGWNDWSEHPRRTLRLVALSDTAFTVHAADTPIKISGILISNQTAGAEVVRFRDIDNSPEHFSLNIGASKTEFFPIHVQLNQLEVICDSATDVDVTIFTCSGTLGTTLITS